MFTVLHLADVHIGNQRRSEEYRKVFATLKQFCDERKPDYTVIAGDVFHNKDRYSGEDVDDYYALIDALASSGKIVVIPGNHDRNPNAPQRCDLISPLRANIIYQAHTGPIPGTPFHHIAAGDTKIRCDDTRDKIIIYHGTVDGVKFGKHTTADTQFPIQSLNAATAVLLGDIHEHTAMSPTCVYPGSLIQQNVGESQCKGVVMWKFDDMIPTWTFHQIANESGFLKLDLRNVKNTDGSSVNMDEYLKGIVRPKNLIKVSLVVDDETAQHIAQAQAIYGRVDKVVRQDLAVDPSKDMLSALHATLSAKNVPQEIIADILAQHQSGLATHNISRWHVTKLSWDNFYKYGTSNCIDFTKLSGGTSGAIAQNRAGKSSIIDILVYALWGEYLRGDKKTMIRRGATSCQVRVDFVHNGEHYILERREDTSKHSKINFSKVVGQEIQNLTEATADATYRKVKALIGSLPHFLSTGLYYDPQYDITTMGKADRMRTLPALFGHQDPAPLLEVLKAQKKQLKAELDALPKLEDVSQYDAYLNAQTTVMERIAQLQLLPTSARSKDIVTAELEKSRATIVTLTAAVKPAYNAPPQAPPAPLTDAQRKKLMTLQDNDETHILNDLTAVGANESTVVVHTSDAEISALERKIVQPPDYTAQIAASARQLENLRRNSNLNFAVGCQCCDTNKRVLAADLANAEAQHHQLVAKDQGSIELRLAANAERDRINDLRRASKIITLQERLQSLRRDAADARAQIAAADAGDAWSLWERNEKIRAAIEKHTQSVAQLEIELSTSGVDTQKELSELNRKLGVVQTKIADITAKREQNDRRNQLTPALEQKLALATAYVDALMCSSLKMRLITQSAKILTDRVNDLLAQVCDFTLVTNVDGAALEFQICENATTFPLNIASGYQKFVTSIAIRLAFTLILPSRCDFMMIDEGFGCMDHVNISRMADLFTNITPMYKFVFIISHVNELHNIITHPIYIGTREHTYGICSHVTNTSAAPSQARGIQPKMLLPAIAEQPKQPTDQPAYTPAPNIDRAANMNDVDALVDNATGVKAPDTPAVEDPSMVTCECGAKVKKSSLTSHKKTAKHVKAMEK